MNDRIKNRYFRKVIAYPDGAVVHYGDCRIFGNNGICTCGLLLDLIPTKDPESIYPKFWEEWYKQENAFELICV